MYDVRKSCDRSPEKDGPLCYKEAEWMPIWLNHVDVKKELGANPAINFTSSSQKVNKDFLSSGDLMYYSAGLLTDLVDDGIRLLVYAGDTGKNGNICHASNISSHFYRRCLQCLGSVEMGPETP